MSVFRITPDEIQGAWIENYPVPTNGSSPGGGGGGTQVY